MFNALDDMDNEPVSITEGIFSHSYGNSPTEISSKQTTYNYLVSNTEA